MESEIANLDSEPAYVSNISSPRHSGDLLIEDDSNVLMQ